MRNACVLIPLSVIVAFGVASPAFACGKRIKLRCGETVHRVHAAERNSAAQKQQKLEEAIARAKAEREAAEAAAARAKDERQLAEDAIALAKREQQLAEAAFARARQTEQDAQAAKEAATRDIEQMKRDVAAEKKEADQIKQSAEDLQDFLHGKILEEKNALDAALRRERAADGRDREAAAKIKDAEARERKASEEIKKTQDERIRLDKRFDELLGTPTCGGAKKTDCPTS